MKLPDKTPQNEKDRARLERDVENFIANGGIIRAYGVTESEPIMSRRELNELAKRRADARKTDR